MNAIKLIIYTFNSYKISRVCLHHTAIQLSIPPLVHREEGFNEIVFLILLEPNEPNENYTPLKSRGHQGPQITACFFVCAGLPAPKSPRSQLGKKSARPGAWAFKRVRIWLSAVSEPNRRQTAVLCWKPGSAGGCGHLETWR